MKIEFTKTKVMLTMNRDQFSALKAAIDSVTSIGEHSTDGYKDVFQFENALVKAMARWVNENDCIIDYENKTAKPRR